MVQKARGHNFGTALATYGTAWLPVSAAVLSVAAQQQFVPQQLMLRSPCFVRHCRVCWCCRGDTWRYKEGVCDRVEARAGRWLCYIVLVCVCGF